MNSIVATARRGRESARWRRFVLERLHRLFALLLVLQWIQCFKGYWWSETYHVIYGSLAVYAATELLISRAIAGRLAIQLAGVFLSVVAFAPMQWHGWPVSWRQWEEVRRFIVWHGEQFHPFAELAVGVLLVTHVLAAWAATRNRAIAVLLVSVVTMAAVDSYFPYELWPHIALAVLAGLGWLVVIHLQGLRERHYDSWAALAERPFELALPAALVIGILILLGVLMPRAPVLLEDPYTLWMEAQNKSVPGMAGEGGYLINGSSSSSGGSGSSKSGYGRNDSQIGGGFQFDYSPVMQVTTSQKSYWRGETKAVYTGKGWADRKGMQTEPVEPGSKKLPLDPPRTQKEGVREVVQTVTMLRKDRYPVLFAAGPASEVEEINGGNNPKLFWNPEEWELRFQRPTPLESYTVVSEVQELDENRLRETPAVPKDGQASIDLDPYLQLPDSLPQRVRDLARQTTKQATNDYDRLKLLESYLQTTYPYTNTPDTSKQRSSDVVDAFLFEIKEGYCDYYSTAFVVMARSLGIPTRWVKGYTSGSNPADEERARYGGVGNVDPDGAGTYTVRNADAHSWAEAYFEGYGWVPFEPTAGFSIPVPKPKEAVAPSVAPADTAETPEEEAPRAAAGDWRKPAAIAAAAAGAIALLALSAFAVLKRRKLLASWRTFRHRGDTPNQRIVREMESLVRFMQRKGFKRHPHETLRETVESWGGRAQTLKPDLEGALKQFEAARYGGGNVDEEAYRRFSQTAERIRKAL
jgi:transglutaminase-like putative cysteine protease